MRATHTANAVTSAVTGGIREPGTAVPLGALAATIAGSRLALNRPTDVLVEVALGATVGVSIALAHKAHDSGGRHSGPVAVSTLLKNKEGVGRPLPACADHPASTRTPRSVTREAAGS